MSFSFFTTQATVKRLSAYSGDKSSYASVAGTIEGQFQPINPSMATVALNIVSQAYQFITDGDQDIRAGDVLTVDSADYGVKGVSLYRQGSIQFLKCTLEKSIQK